MSPRKLRRLEAHQARKAARKAGFPTTTVAEPSSTVLPNPAVEPPKPPRDTPAKPPVSEARSQAARQNGAQSHGPLTPEARAISAQNHTIHGLARHRNGTFKLLSSEDPAAFEALKQSLLNDHRPINATECILVDRMAESDWLAQRAQRLLDTCLDPDTGKVTDEKQFSLYLRYHTTHTRAFHKCLTDLLKYRAARHKAELGFEAQKNATEKHEMSKERHFWEIAKKDALACQEISRLRRMNSEAGMTNPNFHEEYEAELNKRGLRMDGLGASRMAA